MENLLILLYMDTVFIWIAWLWASHHSCQYRWDNVDTVATWYCKGILYPLVMVTFVDILHAIWFNQFKKFTHIYIQCILYSCISNYVHCQAIAFPRARSWRVFFLKKRILTAVCVLQYSLLTTHYDGRLYVPIYTD